VGGGAVIGDREKSWGMGEKMGRKGTPFPFRGNVGFRLITKHSIGKKKKKAGWGNNKGQADLNYWLNEEVKKVIYELSKW